MSETFTESGNGGVQVPGPTGRFPQGKLNEDDKGELLVGLVIDQNKLILHFNRPTAWIGMDRDTALAFANEIINNANKL